MIIEFSDEEILEVLRELGYTIEVEKVPALSRRRKFQKLGSRSFITINEKKYSIYEVFKKELLNSISKK